MTPEDELTVLEAEWRAEIGIVRAKLELLAEEIALENEGGRN